MDDKQFYDIVREIVEDTLRQKNMLVGNWHLGYVDSVVNEKRLKVLVDGGEIPQTISCNPDVTFEKGDYVWVIYINGNPRDKFVLCKRAV